MKRVFILHLLPLEFYPPITNLLHVLDSKRDFKVKVFSTKNNKNRASFKSKSIAIFRTVYPAYTSHLLAKLWAYFAYIVYPLYRLILFKPDSLVYYEPHSAMPAYLYKRFFNRKVRLFIHYHEYYSKDDFNGPSMAAVRFFHKLEVSFLYQHAKWISQTNKDRLDLFKKDYPFINEGSLHTLANYPPQEWQQASKKETSKKPLKLVYLGALSLENTYVKELLDFVSIHPEQVSLSLYSYTAGVAIKELIENYNAKNIRLIDDGVSYRDIPHVAKNYDIGLILYNGHNLNYTYNAPNKLFEYLACGLNVWFPKDLTGCLPYINKNTRPVVKAIDFKNLESSLIEDYYNTLNLPFSQPHYSCENELQSLVKALKS